MEPHKPGKAKTIWIITLIFVVGLSNTAWGLFYFKQTNNNTQLSSKVNNLTGSVNDLNNEVLSLKSPKKDTTSTTFREIPELGVKYKPSEATKDITYSYTLLDSSNTHEKSIGLSTLELTESAPKNALAIKNMNSSIGTMEAGQPCTSQDPPAMIIKYSKKPAQPESLDGGLEDRQIGMDYYRFMYTKLNGSTKCSQDQFSEAIKRGLAAFHSLEKI